MGHTVVKMCDTSPESRAHQAVCRLLFISIAFFVQCKKNKVALVLSLKLVVISHNFSARRKIINILQF